MAASSKVLALLEKLQNSHQKTTVLEELNTLLSSTSKTQLQEIAPNIFYDVLFECLITANEEQIQLTCTVLEKLFVCLDPAVVLGKYQGDLLRGLEHSSNIVKTLSLNQILKGSESISQQVASSPDILHHLVGLLADKSLAVAEKAIKIFVNLARNQESLEVLLQPDYTLHQLEMVKETSDAVRFRVYEMAISIANVSQEALTLLTSRSGLLQQLSDEVLNDDDILLQLNALEMLKDLALTPHGLAYLDSQGVLKKVEAMLVSIDANPLAGLLLPGLLKFFGNICYLHPEELSDRFQPFLTLLFGNMDSNDVSLATIVIETIGLLGSKPEGKLALHKQGKKMLDACRQIGSLISSGPSQSRAKCLQAASVLITLRVEDQTAELLSVTETWFNNFHKDTLQLLLHIAKQPFLELRCSSLNMITSAAMTSWGQQILNNHPGFNEYLLDRSTENTKEGKEAKYEIIKTLVHSPTSVDIFGRPYHVKLKQYEREGPFYLEAEAAVAFEEAS